MLLPKRPAPYILGLLLVILLILTVWLFKAVTSPDLRDAVKREAVRKSRAESDSETAPR